VARNSLSHTLCIIFTPRNSLSQQLKNDIFSPLHSLAFSLGYKISSYVLLIIASVACVFVVAVCINCCSHILYLFFIYLLLLLLFASIAHIYILTYANKYIFTDSKMSSHSLQSTTNNRSRRGRCLSGQQGHLMDSIYRNGRVVPLQHSGPSPSSMTPLVGSKSATSSSHHSAEEVGFTPTSSIIPSGTLPRSWCQVSVANPSTMHEELQEENIDLMDDVLDDVPADSPYKVLAITFASMKEFSEWKLQQNFNWCTTHRSKNKGIFEKNEPSFIHYKCNSCESCTVEMRMEYEWTTGGNFHIQVSQRGTHGSVGKKMTRGMPAAMRNVASGLLQRGLKPNEVVRQIVSQLNSDGIDDDKTVEQRLKQVQNMKCRMRKESGNAGIEMTSMEQLRNFTAQHVLNGQNREYFRNLGKMNYNFHDEMPIYTSSLLI
jgi:hypothetical protein